MKDPQKTFVRVLAWNTPMNILTYVLPTTLALAVLGNWQQWETGYIVEARSPNWRRNTRRVMLVASIIGTLSLSNSTILYTTRVPATMAQDGYLPAVARRRFIRASGRPTRAIAFSTLIYCFSTRFSVEILIAVYIWTRIATTLFTLFAAWQHAPEKCLTRRGNFRIPGGRARNGLHPDFPCGSLRVQFFYSDPIVLRWAPWLIDGRAGRLRHLAMGIWIEADGAGDAIVAPASCRRF